MTHHLGNTACYNTSATVSCSLSVTHHFSNTAMWCVASDSSPQLGVMSQRVHRLVKQHIQDLPHGHDAGADEQAHGTADIAWRRFTNMISLDQKLCRVRYPIPSIYLCWTQVRHHAPKLGLIYSLCKLNNVVST